MIALVGVVVPAADEQQLIGPCLDALAAAREHLRGRHPNVGVRVVVALDSCTDATAEQVAARGDAATEAVAFGQVGATRAAGVRALLCGASRPRGEIWLANTDADSQVCTHWLSGMVELADRGADLVLGTVLPGSGLATAVESRWHAEHALRDGHPHVHGANFGIRADAYAALRGWPQLPTGEDVELARRATATGRLRIARSAAIPVHTSVRENARAPSGFSSHLRGLAVGRG